MNALLGLVRLSLQCLVFAAIASCGGGGGGDSSHPPSLSNLRYSPSTALQVPNGTATISGTVDFADAGGDIVALRLLSSGGADLTVPMPSLGGATSGSATGLFVVPVGQVGKTTFDLWATDDQGHASNRLSGTFEVLPAMPRIIPLRSPI